MTDTVCPRCKDVYQKDDDTGVVKAEYGETKVAWNVCAACYADVLQAIRTPTDN